MDPELFVFTVITDITTGAENWIRTADHFGYRYKILGLGEKWQGWPWRTRKYIEAVSAVPPNDFVVLVDGLDLFFVGPPSDLVTTFMRKYEKGYYSPVVISGESACCTGKYSGDANLKQKVHQFAMKHYKQRNRYPNGGFIMGRAKNVLCILGRNIIAEDDQAGYVDMWLSKDPLIIIDSEQHLCANFPNMENSEGVRPPDYDKSKTELDYWHYDPFRNRIQNKQSESWPAVFHFSGQNWKHYNLIASMIFHNSPLYNMPETSLADTKVKIKNNYINGERKTILYSISIIIVVITLSVIFVAILLYHRQKIYK